MAPNLQPTHTQLETARQHPTDALKALDTTTDTPTPHETLLKEAHREANHWHTRANQLQHDNQILLHLVNKLTHQLRAVGANPDNEQYLKHLTSRSNR